MPFSSARRRIARAKEHIVDIKSGINSFFQTKPYERIAEINSRGFEEHKVRLTADIPARITDLTFEAVEALRSSLDQATYAVAIACHASRPDLVHFPVADTASDIENILNGRLRDFPPEVLTLFRAFKAYKGGNDFLWALNRIRRQGSHRLIVPVGTQTGEFFIENIQITSPHPLNVMTQPKWNGEKNEMIFATTGPGSDLQYKIDMSFFVAFGTTEGFAGEPLIETLEDTASEAERVVSAIETETTRIGLFG